MSKILNRKEAKSVLDNELDRFRTMSHGDLVHTVRDGVYTMEKVGKSGGKYLIQIKTKWKKRKKNIIRVSANIRSADVSIQESSIWNIPVLNVANRRISISGLFATFTQGPDD